MWLSKCVRSLVFTPVLALSVQGFAQTNTLPVISAIDATNYLNQQVIVVDKVAQVAGRPPPRQRRTEGCWNLAAPEAAAPEVVAG